MAKKKVNDADNIKESVDNIRDECDKIEEEIEPKKARTAGDPCVDLY